MEEPKIQSVIIWQNGTQSKRADYISVNQLKDWINEQADKRQTDLGTNFTLSQLEKFIEEP